jgi:hypothetical protein
MIETIDSKVTILVASLVMLEGTVELTTAS